MRLRGPIRDPSSRTAALAIAWGFATFLIGAAVGAPWADEPPPTASEQGTSAPVATVSFADTAGGEPPIGVLNGRALSQGTIRLGYRYTRVWMRGNWSGPNEISESRAFSYQSPPYLSVPGKRTLQQHLLSAAWAPFSRLTVVARLPIYLKEQTTDRAAGGRFRTRTAGVGDLRVLALVPFMRKGNETLLVSFGFRAPTGSIRETGTVATASGLQTGRLAYPMQPGKGSWALTPGATYRGHWKSLSWGVQYQGVFWLDVNSQNYRPGTEHAVSTWMAWNWATWVSTSARFAWNRSSNVHRGDPEIGTYPYGDPTENPMVQGGQQLVVGPGINLRLPFLGGQHLGFEALFPIWRDLDGPQLGNRWLLHAGLKIDF